ncbi:MAG TPA: thiamine-phosphate kinase [Actinomycetota bacterium]
MVSEDELVHAIRKVLSGDAPGVVVGVGDDAAVVELGEGQAVLTVDTMVEEVHWDPSITTPHELGHKAVTVNVSDIAAMGGSPRFGLVSLAIARETPPAWVMEVYGGMREAAETYGVALIGGDTVRADRTVLTVALTGRVPTGRAVTRGGARLGEAIVVTGALGAAAGALALSKAGPELKRSLGTDWERSLMEALQQPVALVGEGEALASAGATAMIDVSDGLALDLSRICEMSEVGALVRLEDIPVAPELRELAGVIEVDPLELALHGGEDYQLLATMPAGAFEDARSALDDRFGTTLTVIGEVTHSGLELERPDGSREPLAPSGWDHFA